LALAGLVITIIFWG